MMPIPFHISVANVECPYCHAAVTKPCRASTGYNYNFGYSHAGRVRLWVWRYASKRS